MKYIQQASEEDLEAIRDREITFGEKITAPQYYPDEYKDILQLVCKDVPEKNPGWRA